MSGTPDLRDCSRANAAAVMRVPAEFGNPTTCLMHAQAYLAETSIGQELGTDFGLFGAATELDRVEQLNLLDVNARALTDVTLRFLPGMVTRGRGGVFN
jgi:hypothetical protein